MVVHQLISSSSHQLTRSQSQNLGTGPTQNLNSQHYLSLLITPEDAQFHNLGSNQQSILTNNISPATVIEDESLATIFSFKINELFKVPLFSKAAFKEKPITVIYTNAKVDDQFIKLILDNGSAGSIITKQFMDQLSCRVDHTASAKIITANRAIKTPIGKIDNFSIEVNAIIVPIRVLVMEATQY
ncbi:hypothetical protein G9A89_017523 [Geosiphon pyriformis]|nr:hypothetical protein G9A89_017523 [Geosiphon pyriformis]